MSSSPIETRRDFPKKASDGTGEYFDYFVKFYELVFLDIARVYSPNPDVIFEGGCGKGASTLAIGRAFPQSRIEGVGLHDQINTSVREEIGQRLSFEENLIKEAFRERTEMYGIVLLANVLGHEFETEVDYALLANKVKAGGLVIEYGDTMLNPRYMRKYFTRVGTPLNDRFGLQSQEVLLWKKSQQGKSIADT